MLQTLYVGNVYGTRIYIHWSFWLLAIVVFLGNLGSGFSAAMSVLGFVFAVFACVFLHELGHALAARAFGRATRDITLLPIGGVARIEGQDLDAWADGWIAVAGPAVNFGIAAVLMLGSAIAGSSAVPPAAQLAQMTPTQQLILANLVLAISNLIPALPLDGGRLLRSLLCYGLDRPRAYLLAGRIGQWTSGILILLSLVWFQLMGVLFGGLLFLINTAQRMQAYLMMVNSQGFPSGAGGNGPFPYSPWNQGPWSRPPGSEPDWEPRAGGGRGDTVDAIEVREVPSQSPNRLQ